MFLRDIIDLEATYADPDAKARPVLVIAPMVSRSRPPGVRVPGAPGRADARADGGAAAAIPFKPATDDEGREKVEGAAEGDSRRRRHGEPLSLAAIEAELKPKVVETFENIADATSGAPPAGPGHPEQAAHDLASPAQDRRYKKLKNDIITEVKSLRLNGARIDALVEELYDMNKRLVGYEAA